MLDLVHLLVRPQPLQAQAEQTVRRAEASIRTGEYAHLVVQGEVLEEEVSTRRQARPEPATVRKA
jgi:hypothetical protein